LISKISKSKTGQIVTLATKQSELALFSLAGFPVNFVRPPEQAKILDEQLLAPPTIFVRAGFYF
jgi:hypothetical protein